MLEQIANDFGHKSPLTQNILLCGACLSRRAVIKVIDRAGIPCVNLGLFFAKYRKTIYMNDKAKSALLYGGSVAVGFISGFFGGGGGMLAVPLLQQSGLDAKRAHATALFVILPICIISAAIYISNGYFDTQTVLCACIGVVLGGIVGAFMLNKLNSTVISLIFAFLMIAIGIKLVIV